MAPRLLLAGLFTLALAVQPARAQNGRGIGVGQAGARRVALVIGNGAYRNVPRLANPVNDARDVAALLRSLGFEVVFGEDQTAEQMNRLVVEFGDRLSRGGGVGLFYYAGHGVQVGGRNYLIPVEAGSLRERTIEWYALDLNRVLAEMDDADNGFNLVILDACRNNPFAREWRSAAEGLAQVNAPAGTLIAYATAPGAVASDGTGRNGLYTQALLEKMRTPGLPVEELFKRVRVRVKELTAGRQVPWESSSLVGDFFFAGAPATPAPAPAFSSEAVELIFWDSIKTSSDPEDLQEYLSKYPQGKFAGLARRRLASLSAARVDESKPDLARMSEAYALRSEALYVSGDYDGAIRQATEAIRLDEKSARAYGDRCDAYRVKGQHDQAVSDCTEAIRLSPDKGWYHALRGEIYRAKGQSELAVSDCTEAIRLDPKSAFAFNVRGESYRKLQQFERALSDLNEAIRLMPKWSYPYIIRGAIYYDTKDYTRALADFSEGIRLGQNDAWAYGWRAIAYDKLGDDARAKEDRKRAAELKGKN